MSGSISTPARRNFLLPAAVHGAALAGGGVLHVDGGALKRSEASVQKTNGGTVFAPTNGKGRLFRDGWTVFGFRGLLPNFHFEMDGVSAGGVTAKLQAMVTTVLAGEIGQANSPSTGRSCF